MSFVSCPTAVIEAPIDVVWTLLTDPIGWDSFFAVRVLRIDPPGPAAAGQRIEGESGPRLLHLKIQFRFIEVDPEHHRLAIDIRSPFGMRVLEDMHCMPLTAETCRVDYHCDFDFADGWRGALIRLLTARERRLGPIDSLSRLKFAAERRWSEGVLPRGAADILRSPVRAG